MLVHLIALVLFVAAVVLLVVSFRLPGSARLVVVLLAVALCFDALLNAHIVVL
jgi:hypothetical protein